MSNPTPDKQKKPENDIRIGMNSRVRNVIRYATNIMKEKNLKELKFSAVGGSIGRLLDTVEVLKILIPGLYQQNKITSVAYQTLDSGNNVLNQKLYPKMEIVLTTEEPKNKNEGFQDKLNEEDRKKIEKIMNERREEREKNRGGRRRGNRGGRRFGFRGRRPFGFRGRRGFRGRGFRVGNSGFRGRGFRGGNRVGGNRRGGVRRGNLQRGMRRGPRRGTGNK